MLPSLFFLCSRVFKTFYNQKVGILNSGKFFFVVYQKENETNTKMKE